MQGDTVNCKEYDEVKEKTNADKCQCHPHHPHPPLWWCGDNPPFPLTMGPRIHSCSVNDMMTLGCIPQHGWSNCNATCHLYVNKWSQCKWLVQKLGLHVNKHDNVFEKESIIYCTFDWEWSQNMCAAWKYMKMKWNDAKKVWHLHKELLVHEWLWITSINVTELSLDYRGETTRVHFSCWYERDCTPHVKVEHVEAFECVSSKLILDAKVLKWERESWRRRMEPQRKRLDAMKDL